MFYLKLLLEELKKTEGSMRDTAPTELKADLDAFLQAAERLYTSMTPEKKAGK